MHPPDFAQIPPVHDKALFQELEKNTSTYQTKGRQLFLDHFINENNTIIFNESVTFVSFPKRANNFFKAKFSP